MFVFAYPESPTFLGESNITVVSTEPITSVRNTKAASGPAQATQATQARVTLKRTTTQQRVPAVIHIPATESWGTTLLVIRVPAIRDEHPIPLCHRAGSTLWVSNNKSFISGRHVVEAVVAEQWYLVGSHTSTDHVWWDVAEWGGAMATTLAVETSTVDDDCGVVVVAHDGEVAIDRAVTFSRTFGHDDTLRFAESKQLPDEPTSDWKFDPRKVIVDDSGVGQVFDRLGRNPAATLYGTIGSARSTSAPSQGRRTSSTISPAGSRNPTIAESLHLVTYTATGPIEGVKVVRALSSSKLRTTTDLTTAVAPESDLAASISLMQQL